MSSHLPPLALAAVAAFLITSCSSDTPERATREVPAATAPQQIIDAPILDADAMEGEAAPAPNSGTPRLNPPHGEPGHVCEIAVGEPLDGSGKAGTENQNIQIVQPDMGGGSTFSMPLGGPANDAPASGGSGRLNPAHGEPGHVCEIPVGQPLP